MRTLHSPLRPFQCPYAGCEHAFRRANSFWRHLVEEHPDKSSEHSDIYQEAIRKEEEKRKMEDEARLNSNESSLSPNVLSTNGLSSNGLCGLSVTTCNMELPLTPLSPTESNPLSQSFSSLSAPFNTNNESMIYRGHDETQEY